MRHILVVQIVFTVAYLNVGVAQTGITSVNDQTPDSVALVSPRNFLSFGTGDSVTFVWRKSQPNVTRYWFEFAFDRQFVFAVIDSIYPDTVKGVRFSSAHSNIFWRARAGNSAGWSAFSETRELVMMDAVPPQSILNRFELEQNFPNPFNPSTTIRYGLPNRSHVMLAVFNNLGQQVAVFQNGEQDAGYHEVKFNGSALSSGVYFYRIQAGEFVLTKKLLLLH
jgi:hypothetical protein